MALGYNKETVGRGVVEVTWDPTDFALSEVMIVATNPDALAEDSDISNKSGPNDGSMTFTYPDGYSGRTKFVISDDDGNEQSATFTVEDGVVTNVEDDEVDETDDDEGEND